MNSNIIIPLEQFLTFNDQSLNKLEFRLIRSYPPSDEFNHTLNACIMKRIILFTLLFILGLKISYAQLNSRGRQILISPDKSYYLLS